MKWLYGLVLSALLLACALGAEGLGKVRSVYLLQMSNGLDQCLANEIASRALFQVVTDPRRADAILTDRVGTAFETRLDDLLRPKDEPKKDAKDAKVTEEQPVRLQSSGRGLGAIFLVDPKSRAVLWSTYERPKTGAPAQVNRAARVIALRLEKALRGK